jgi:hypothetical protein
MHGNLSHVTQDYKATMKANLLLYFYMIYLISRVSSVSCSNYESVLDF